MKLNLIVSSFKIITKIGKLDKTNFQNNIYQVY